MKNKATPPPTPPTSRKQAPSLSIHTYFHTNSIFMGVTRSLQRVGSGLILFHDGTCAIVSYNGSSEFEGKCVFYRNRGLISVGFLRNRVVDVAYRVDGYLMYLRYNQQAQLHGEAYIVSFVERSIHKIRYEEGILREKMKMLTIDKMPIQTVFLNQAFHVLIGKSHSRSIRHELTQEDVQNVRVRKIGNKVQVHYMENSQEKLAQGLGFEFVFRAPENGGYNPETNVFKDEFQLKVVQKGTYKNNMLQGYGMRIFKNNNAYEGYFHQNIFHGEGCLKNMQKGNWVYGIFENGEMKDIMDFCNQGNQSARCNGLLENLRRKEKNFINAMIEENNFDFLDAELEKICGMGDIQEYRNQNFNDRKQEIMRKITAQFIELEAINKSTLQQEINRLKNSQLQLASTIKTKSKNVVQGSQTQRKQRQHTIKSLMPQSIKSNNYFNLIASKNNEREMQNFEEEKQNFQKAVDLSKSRKLNDKKYGKIFHKNYDHFEKPVSQSEVTPQKSSSAHKRIRKSQIFTTQSPLKQLLSQISLSPSRLNGQESPNLVYKGRSPDRKTTIFPDTIKLKKLTNSPNQPGGISNEQLMTTKSRKNSIQKRNKAATKVKKSPNSQIFDEPKQRVTENAGKFLYKYQEQQAKSTEQKPDHPTDKKYANLKPPSLLLSKTQRT